MTYDDGMVEAVAHEILRNIIPDENQPAWECAKDAARAAIAAVLEWQMADQRAKWNERALQELVDSVQQ